MKVISLSWSASCSSSTQYWSILTRPSVGIAWVAVKFGINTTRVALKMTKILLSEISIFNTTRVVIDLEMSPSNSL